MTQDKQLKRKARQLAAETGQSYQSALHQLDPTRGATAAQAQTAAHDAPPAVFSSDRPAEAGYVLSWDRLIEHLDDAEARLDDPDPYARAAAFRARARLYHQLYAQTTDAVYGAACARASVCDDISAARIRFEHGIATITPRTEAELVGLRACPDCGRPWQRSVEGACPRCPRLLFGATPTSRQEAESLPPGTPVRYEGDRDAETAEQDVAHAAAGVYRAARAALADFIADHEMAAAVSAAVLRAAAEQCHRLTPDDLREWADRIDATA